MSEHPRLPEHVMRALVVAFSVLEEQDVRVRTVMMNTVDVEVYVAELETLSILPCVLGKTLKQDPQLPRSHAIVESMNLVDPEGVTYTRKVFFSWNPPGA